MGAGRRRRSTPSWTTSPMCWARRVRWARDGKSIGDVLKIEVDEAVDFFATMGNIAHPLRLLEDVGIGFDQRAGAQAAAAPIQPAIAIVVRSCRYGPITCKPIGRPPSALRPTGTAVAGRPGNVATPGQAICRP